MRTTLLLVLLLSVQALYASTTDFFNSMTAKALCAEEKINIIRGDENTIAFSYMSKRESYVKLVNLVDGNIQKLEQKDKIKDILFIQDKIFILTTKELIQYERQTGYEISRTRTLPNNLIYGKYRGARGLYLTDSSIFIAHGIYGIIELDRYSLEHLRILNPSVPQPNDAHISMVTDIEGKDGKLYATLDNVTIGPGPDERAFEGLIIYDHLNDKMIRVIPVNQRKEAYHMSTLTMLEDELIISNLHLNFRHKLSKLATDRTMRPFQRLWRYPQGSLKGHPYITNTKIYGCFENFNTGVISSGSYKL